MRRVNRILITVLSAYSSITSFASETRSFYTRSDASSITFGFQSVHTRSASSTTIDPSVASFVSETSSISTRSDVSNVRGGSKCLYDRDEQIDKLGDI